MRTVRKLILLNVIFILSVNLYSQGKNNLFFNKNKIYQISNKIFGN